MSVDPQRDTPGQRRAYLASFAPRIIGLTGSEEQIAAISKDGTPLATKPPASDGSNDLVLSAYAYLMDRRNRQAGTLNFQESEAEQLAKLRQLLQ